MARVPSLFLIGCMLRVLWQHLFHMDSCPRVSSYLREASYTERGRQVLGKFMPSLLCAENCVFQK